MYRLLVALMLHAGLAFAAEPQDLRPVPDGPVEAGGGQEGEPLPDVTIIRREQGTIEEYRLNGRLYQVKVTPKYGIPFYLIDTDGDGSLETRRDELGDEVIIPAWVIFTW